MKVVAGKIILVDDEVYEKALLKTALIKKTGTLMWTILIILKPLLSTLKKLRTIFS